MCIWLTRDSEEGAGSWDERHSLPRWGLFQWRVMGCPVGKVSGTPGATSLSIKQNIVQGVENPYPQPCRMLRSQHENVLWSAVCPAGCKHLERESKDGSPHCGQGLRMGCTLVLCPFWIWLRILQNMKMRRTPMVLTIPEPQWFPQNHSRSYYLVSLWLG